jgi:hypothetical protein
MIPFSKAKLLIGFFVSFLAFSSLSQTTPKHCGTDEMHQELFKTHPEYNAGILRAYERLQADTKAYEKQNHEKSDALYVIPIVFHVIHNYGVENINDDQILDAVKQLNIQFRKLNTKIVVGHYHSPGRKDGALAVGTSTKLRVNYNIGPSGWLQSHVIIHHDSKAQHINFIKGEFTTLKP